MGPISHKLNFKGKFSDKRLERRAEQLSASLLHGRSSVIRSISASEAEQKAAYRFLANEQVQEAQLIETLTEKSGTLCPGRALLVIQDTSEFNLADHHNRLQVDSGLGPAGKSGQLGFFTHASLVVDAQRHTILGFSDLQLWHREQDGPDKYQRGYHRLPIEKKESYKWIKACEQSKQKLSGACCITFIEDREGDIYEQFCTVADEHTQLVVRSRDDRRLQQGPSLYATLQAQPLAGCYQVEIVKDIRKQVESRTATVQVRHCPVEIARPRRAKTDALPASMKLYAIEAKEATGPVGGKKVLWRLLTTWPVENFQQATAVIQMYRMRWMIEQLFRLLKKKGYRIESTELESGWAIRKLTLLTLGAALRVMQMLLAYGNEESQGLEEVFDAEEIACLRQLNEGLQGPTPITCNHNPPDKLSWATWIIARLGGWKGYLSQRPPGPITLKQGLDRFNAIFQGWQLALQMNKDVSTR